MLNINNIRVSENNTEILKNISISFKEQDITFIIGQSGAGKTTLLRACAGLIRPSAGSISLQGTQFNKLTPRARAQKIGFVFQSFNLFAHMTVLQNCVDPMLIQGVDITTARQRAKNILTELGLANKCDEMPDRLSGGQQQRVAIARALCLQPSVLLLDEPTASLDPENKNILIDILRVCTSKGITVIASTQDMDLARKAENILFMQDGTIVEACYQANSCTTCTRIQDFLHKTN